MRTPRTALAVVALVAVALSGCRSNPDLPEFPSRPSRSPARDFQVDASKRLEVNPPWASPQRVRIPEPPNSPVSLFVQFENHGKKLLEHQDTYAVFRKRKSGEPCIRIMEPGDDAEKYEAKIAWDAGLSGLSEAYVYPPAIREIQSCDPALRAFLAGATHVDVRVQIRRADGHLSYNPPEILVEPPPVATGGASPGRTDDVIGMRELVLRIPFENCVPIERPLVSLKTCDDRPQRASVGNPPYGPPTSVRRPPNNSSPVTLLVDFENGGSPIEKAPAKRDAEIHVSTENGKSAVFSIYGDDFAKLHDSIGTQTKPECIPLRLLKRNDGPDPFDFFKAVDKAKPVCVSVRLKQENGAWSNTPTDVTKRIATPVVDANDGEDPCPKPMRRSKS